jgi:hypothetical protein
VREAPALKEVDNVVPTDRVKGLAYIKFEKERGGFTLVKPSSKVFDI